LSTNLSQLFLPARSAVAADVAAAVVRAPDRTFAVSILLLVVLVLLPGAAWLHAT